MDFYSTVRLFITTALWIDLISNRQHPQPVSEPEPEEEVHVTGVHSLQQGQDEGRHQVRVQEAAPQEGDATISEALALYVTGQEEALTCTCSCSCSCTCTCSA